MAKILEAKQLTDKLKKAIEVKLSHSPKLTLASLRPDLKDYSSQLFIAQQEKIASELGPNIDYRLILLKASLSQGEVLKTIAKLNADSAVTAIALTKPFPKDWKDQDLFKAIDPNKDIEGISPYNLGRLALGNALFIPPTVLSILELIKDTGLKLRGKRVTIVGSSNIITLIPD